jgi:hypothetical protein
MTEFHLSRATPCFLAAGLSFGKSKENGGQLHFQSIRFIDSLPCLYLFSPNLLDGCGNKLQDIQLSLLS